MVFQAQEVGKSKECAMCIPEKEARICPGPKTFCIAKIPYKMWLQNLHHLIFAFELSAAEMTELSVVPQVTMWSNHLCMCIVCVNYNYLDFVSALCTNVTSLNS